jgi:hemolysin III
MPEPVALSPRDLETADSTADQSEQVTPAVLRPTMRGTLHRWSVPVAITLTVLLAGRAGGAGDRAAVIIYGLGITGMLATSGLYHAARFADRQRRLLRRVDHSMILIAISGTYTAVIVLALSGAEQVVLLSIAWGLAAVGVTLRMCFLDAHPALVTAVYLVAGWQLLLDFPAYERVLTAGELALIAVGGGLYSLGAIVYARKRPNPWPAVFGYHEVFHALVVAGAMCQWVAVWMIAV